MTGRFAIYFAPPEGSELEAFGRRWLGRDHITGAHVEQPAIDGLDPDVLQRITRSARHYGFHATLKAPFALKEGQSARDLHAAASSFAAEREPFDAPPLALSRLSRWIAFTLSAPSPEMDRLAADCVRAFEPLRAPLDDDDILRRRESGLTERQDEQLLSFGYPYIFDDFHFHMTLAGPLDDQDQAEVLGILHRLTPMPDGKPLPVDAVAIYEQPSRDRPFIQTARFPFRAR